MIVSMQSNFLFLFPGLTHLCLRLCSIVTVPIRKKKHLIQLEFLYFEVFFLFSYEQNELSHLIIHANIRNFAISEEKNEVQTDMSERTDLKPEKFIQVYAHCTLPYVLYPRTHLLGTLRQLTSQYFIFIIIRLWCILSQINVNIFIG